MTRSDGGQGEEQRRITSGEGVREAPLPLGTPVPLRLFPQPPRQFLQAPWRENRE